MAGGRSPLEASDAQLRCSGGAGRSQLQQLGPAGTQRIKETDWEHRLQRLLESSSASGSLRVPSVSDAPPLRTESLIISRRCCSCVQLHCSSTVRLNPPAASQVEPAGVTWLRAGLRKYSCQLTVNTNTVSRNIKLSDNNRTMTLREELQSYPDHPDRFEDRLLPQLLCRTGLTGLTGRCYWEVEWRGDVEISVSYRGISRRGDFKDCEFGLNDQSWSLSCSDVHGYSVRHNDRQTFISSSSSSSSPPSRVAVYVDCPAGSLSFYRVSSDKLIHLHTFNTTFTEPLYPGFGFWRSRSGSSASVCPL
ncbi:neoverrucotoxin subunit alpha-like [Symphorus nematophorus]